MPQSSTLVRALGRWSFTAILLNLVIGASAFGLPGEVTALLGSYAPWAYVIGGFGILMIGVCFAEVASYFDQAGGPYLYAREAYGRFAGIYIAYLLTFVRISSAAAVTNLFATYLAQFFPGVDGGMKRAIVLTSLLALVVLINFFGVQVGAGASNTFAVLKVGSLALFGVGGIIYLFIHGSVGATAAAPITASSWLQAFVLTVFAYGGIEAGLVPASEAKDARKDAPIAVFATLGTAALLYISVQVAVTFTFPEAAASKRAVGDAAGVIFGAAGPSVTSVAAIIAVCGYLMATILSGPRVLYALAEQGDTTTLLGRVHPRFRTPHVALFTFGAAVWALTVFGTFQWGAFVSAVTRLLIYASVCSAVFVFRRSSRTAGLRIPFAPLAAVLGIAFCAILVSRMGWKELVVMVVVAVLAGISWFAATRAKNVDSHTA
jgi:APA family basic amino acid/polyamine antiporter